MRHHLLQQEASYCPLTWWHFSHRHTHRHTHKQTNIHTKHKHTHTDNRSIASDQIKPHCIKQKHPSQIIWLYEVFLSLESFRTVAITKFSIVTSVLWQCFATLSPLFICVLGAVRLITFWSRFRFLRQTNIILVKLNLFFYIYRDFYFIHQMININCRRARYIFVHYFRFEHFVSVLFWSELLNKCIMFSNSKIIVWIIGISILTKKIVTMIFFTNLAALRVLGPKVWSVKTACSYRPYVCKSVSWGKVIICKGKGNTEYHTHTRTKAPCDLKHAWVQSPPPTTQTRTYTHHTCTHTPPPLSPNTLYLILCGWWGHEVCVCGCVCVFVWVRGSVMPRSFLTQTHKHASSPGVADTQTHAHTFVRNVCACVSVHLNSSFQCK